jgi:hypothetical protein
MSRACGDCQLCCKLLPVRELAKGGGQRCQHQRTGKGCLVYQQPAMPPSCQLWSCRWLVDETAMVSRPDRSHCVIDIMPDFVTVLDAGGENYHDIECIQLWVDPKYPDAHRDPDLRAYLERICRERNAMVLVRYGETEALPLLPPFMNSEGVWHEHHGEGNKMVQQTHSADQIFKATGRIF